jgi:hypothetical protein
MAKVLVSFDDKLLKRIDRAAAERGLTRSAYLTQLAEEEEARQVGPGADPEVREAIRKLRELAAKYPPPPGWPGSTAVIRAQRDEALRKWER